MGQLLSTTSLSESPPKGSFLETYSRRQFMKLSGIAIAASQINFLPDFKPAVIENGYQGRALAALPVYAAPHSSAAILTTLWPDSVITISAVEDDWYQVAQGYVQRESVQPMTPYRPQASVQIPNSPFWAEVSAPIAPIRQSCAADAALVTRIGHGGVAQIMDYLPGEPNGWYAAGDESGSLIGWSQAINWQPADHIIKETGDNHLEIDVSRQHLTARENGDIILQAPCSIGRSIHPGSYAVRDRNPAGKRLFIENIPNEIYGVPWNINFGDGHNLTGAYWHNRFGKGAAGPSIQVTPLLARWLYGWLNENSRIAVV